MPREGAQLQESGDAMPLESAGSDSQPLNAELTGQNYEQITSELKARQAGAAPPEDGSTPESSPPARQEGSGEDDLRLMTDEEIAQLPQELQRHAKALKKRLVGAYTRKTQDLAEIRRRAEFADRFESDPQFRADVIRQYAGQSGSPPTAPPTAQGSTQVPAQYVELRKRTLPQELHWMAEHLAMGDYQRDLAMYQGYIHPLQQRYETSQREAATREYQRVEAEFAEHNPGWDAHEDDMVDVLNFLKSPNLNHPRWGNKIELLYRLATADKQESQAVVQALERTAQAAKNKTITGSGGRTIAPNIEDRVRKAATDREAWDLAKQAAKAARG